MLLDCGLHPKKDGLEALPALGQLDAPPLAVIVSHAHIDHCGAVPRLLKAFPSTECYATQPTLSIMDRMLHNSVSVMGTLALERGISGYPLYSHGDVENALRRAYGLGMGHEFSLSWESPIRAAFHPNGHVLGSASILLRIPGHTLLYSGDVCVSEQELMGGLSPLSDAGVDTLMIECTRGSHVEGPHITLQAEVRKLCKEIKAVLLQGGVALVPSFALGRTQEILNILARLQENGKLPDVPIYASGLGRAVYEVYSKYTEYLKPTAELRPLQGFKRIGDVWERNVRRDLLKSPCIIVATSGMMMENTPSAMLAQDLVRNERHGIFFVGYLDPDTLGHKLLHAKKGEQLTFEVSGQPIEIVLENRQRFHFSAHAHREHLRWIIEKVNPRNVVFVHGDKDAIQWMYDNCPGHMRKFIPAPGEELLIDV